MTPASCDCCTGVTSRTPAPVHNRPGLPEVAYRVGTHPDFLASMVAGLTDADRPALAGLTTRDGDDPTIALLDAWAVVADVLTFHTERLAQESWLRTAIDRRSLQELGRLVGHRMAPGVAAATHLAFAVEPPPAVPAAAGRDPGVAPPVTPASVVVPVGTRVQSIPGPDEKPQTFETVAEVVARPQLNAMPASSEVRAAVASTDEGVHVAGVAAQIAVGDRLLFVRGDPTTHTATTLVTRVTPDPTADRTLVEWDGALGGLGGGGAPVTVHVFRKRLRVFGHNAPSWKAMSSEFKTEYSKPLSPPPSNWPDFAITPISEDAIDIDGAHDDITPDSWLVLDEIHADPGVFKATAVSGMSRAEFAVAGEVTRVWVNGGPYSDFTDVSDVRETVVWAVPEKLELAPGPDKSAVTGDHVSVDTDPSTLQPGAPVIVAGMRAGPVPAAEVATVEGVSIHEDGTWRIDLEEDLAHDYIRETVVVHGNVAPATHGETVDEVLGAGRGSEAFQRFTLAHAPLTHVSSSEDDGTSSTLVVRVNDVAWEQVQTQYDGDPEDHTYTTTVDEHGTRVVQFGDGIRGARLPTGLNNVRATYRKGIGTAGNVGAGAVAQLLDRPLGVKGVSNPLAASGGVDPEEPEDARAAIPLAVRTIGRAVSLLDYEDYALAWPGISKARATVLPLPAGRTIVVTVSPTPGTGDDHSGRLHDLAGSLRDHGDPHVELLVVQHDERSFRLSLLVDVDPDHDPELVLERIREATTAAFSFDARDLLAPVHQSEVVEVAHTVDGVLGVDLDALYLGPGTPSGPLQPRLLPQQPAVAPTASTGVLPAGLVLIDDHPFDVLEVRT